MAATLQAPSSGNNENHRNVKLPMPECAAALEGLGLGYNLPNTARLLMFTVMGTLKINL